MTAIEQLLALARTYAEAEGVSLSTVSSRAFADGKKIRVMENGADISTRRLARTLQWFSDNWPQTAPWPIDIPRPVRIPQPEPTA